MSHFSLQKVCRPLSITMDTEFARWANISKEIGDLMCLSDWKENIISRGLASGQAPREREKKFWERRHFRFPWRRGSFDLPTERDSFHRAHFSLLGSF